MNDSVVEARDLSKTYSVYRRPSDQLAHQLLGWGQPAEVRALEGVSFAVPAGSVLGVVGPNGSGKSTLLGLLAGVLRPSAGSVRVQQPVAALLELGAGFSPELSGLDNARLHLALQGLPPREAERRLPAILDFAGLGPFADRPVKTYSSGMFVRLAFAAAVHADPRVLLVDEALAVGDLQFRHKCAHRIQQLRREGATIVYVSHEVESVRALADQVLLLDAGRPLALGDPEQVCNRYYQLVAQRELAAQQASLCGEPQAEHPAITAQIPEAPARSFFVDAGLEERAAMRYGSGTVRIRGVQLLDEQERPVQIVRFDQRVMLRVSIECLADFPTAGTLGMLIRDADGSTLTGANTYVAGLAFGPRRAGARVVVDFSFSLALREGVYTVTVGVSHDPLQPLFADRLERALTFRMAAASPPLAVVWPIHLHPEVRVWPPSRHA